MQLLMILIIIYVKIDWRNIVSIYNLLTLLQNIYILKNISFYTDSLFNKLSFQYIFAYYLYFYLIIESSMKVFNSYVQLCNMAYWGPLGGP